jgi:hypothetical protein
MIRVVPTESQSQSIDVSSFRCISTFSFLSIMVLVFGRSRPSRDYVFASVRAFARVCVASALSLRKAHRADQPRCFEFAHRPVRLFLSITFGLVQRW